MKKVLLSVIGIVIPLILLIAIIMIPCMMILNFFGISVTDGYVENNIEYAKPYKKVLNKNISKGNGYVSLERILYFYIENEELTFDEIYKDNLNEETKSQRPISEVCELEKYKKLSVCDKGELDESGQIDEEQLKPFSPPLDINNMIVTSFFMEEREVFGNEDIHPAWDFSSNNNTYVYSVCDGKIKKVDFKYESNITDISGGRGNYIIQECIIDEDVKYEVIYAHLFPKSTLLKEGDEVSVNDKIAEVGTTGYSTGPHLHFEVKLDGQEVDGLSLINFDDEDNKVLPNLNNININNNL